jgi:hypothetical protein
MDQDAKERLFLWAPEASVELQHDGIAASQVCETACVPVLIGELQVQKPLAGPGPLRIIRIWHIPNSRWSSSLGAVNPEHGLLGRQGKYEGDGYGSNAAVTAAVDDGVIPIVPFVGLAVSVRNASTEGGE